MKQIISGLTHSAAALALMAASGFLAPSANAQTSEPPADSRTEQSDESYEESLRKRDSERGTVLGCRPGISCTGTGNLPPLRPIDRLPAESAEHIRKARIRIVQGVGIYDETDTPEKFPYEPSVAAQKDPGLQTLEEEAWEELVEGVIADARTAAGLPPQEPGGGAPGGSAPGQGAEGEQSGGEGEGEGEESGDGGEAGEDGAPASTSEDADPEKPDFEARPENQSASIYGWSRPRATFGSGGAPAPTDTGTAPPPGSESANPGGAPGEAGATPPAGADAQAGSEGEANPADGSESGSAGSEAASESGGEASDTADEAAAEDATAEAATEEQADAAEEEEAETTQPPAATQSVNLEDTPRNTRSNSPPQPPRPPTFLERLLGLVEDSEPDQASAPVTPQPPVRETDAEAAERRRRTLSIILEQEQETAPDEDASDTADAPNR